MQSGLLAGTSTYLCGGVEHSSNAISWRVEIAKFLDTLDIKSYDPLIKPPWLDQICHVTPSIYLNVLKNGPVIENGVIIDEAAAIRANQLMRAADLRIAHAVDWIICYLPKIFTSGTFDEVYAAIRDGKPVFFCCPDGIPSTWLLAAMGSKDNFFSDWDSLKRHIVAINKGQIKLDPIEWIFLSWRKDGWVNFGGE